MEGPRYLRPLYVRGARATEESRGPPMTRLDLLTLGAWVILGLCVYDGFQLVFWLKPLLIALAKALGG